MEMRRPERSQQSRRPRRKRSSVAGHAETNRRDGSTTRWIDGRPDRPPAAAIAALAASRLDRHSLPDAVSFVDLDRVRQSQRRRIGLVGGVGPVALILHLPEIAFEPDNDLAARRRVRDRLHVDEWLMG